MRMRWLTGWITTPSPWIGVAIVAALVAAVIFVVGVDPTVTLVANQ
jgi:hypothetical protein